MMCRANRSTDVKSPVGVFWVIDTWNENLVWRVNFTRLEVFIDGETDDFNNTNHNAFQVAGLQLDAFFQVLARCCSFVAYSM